MRILADLHIAPRTVEFLRDHGHDVVRVNDVLPATASDDQIVELARQQARIILTQDLDFSDIIALSSGSAPSLVSMRLSSSRVEHVNAMLAELLPRVQEELLAGAIVVIQDRGVRSRRLPVEQPPQSGS